MADPQRSTSTVDVPVELTMVDGSKWVVHYRLDTDHGGYVEALEWVRRDIDDGRLKPAADPDGVQRGVAQVNMGFVVSVRDPDSDDAAETAAHGPRHEPSWVEGVRWAAAEADAQAAGREPVYILDITDHLRACADDPRRASAVAREVDGG